MLGTFSDLARYTIGATDGDLGDESTTLSCIVVAVAGGTSSGRTAIFSPEHRPTVAPRSAAGGATQYRC